MYYWTFMTNKNDKKIPQSPIRWLFWWLAWYGLHGWPTSFGPFIYIYKKKKSGTQDRTMRTAPRHNKNDRRRKKNMSFCSSTGMVIIAVLILNALFVIGSFSGLLETTLLHAINSKQLYKDIVSRDTIMKYTGIVSFHS